MNIENVMFVGLADTVRHGQAANSQNAFVFGLKIGKSSYDEIIRYEMTVPGKIPDCVNRLKKHRS